MMTTIRKLCGVCALVYVGAISCLPFAAAVVPAAGAAVGEMVADSATVRLWYCIGWRTVRSAAGEDRREVKRASYLAASRAEAGVRFIGEAPEYVDPLACISARPADWAEAGAVTGR